MPVVFAGDDPDARSMRLLLTVLLVPERFEKLAGTLETMIGLVCLPIEAEKGCCSVTELC